ncbi:uncharacterized protein [Anabrus simplex]|uniref:uncharacterized protein n=1 Tax=Anabrus simplex TaxID=316456 RepID=UPI0034DD9AA1
MAEQLVQTVGRHIPGSLGNGNHLAVIPSRPPTFMTNSAHGSRTSSSCSSNTSICSEPGGANSSSDEENRIMCTTEYDMLSHRPIHCPKTPCHSTVAVASLTAHFTFDHPDVPLLTVDPGVKSHLWLSPSSIPLEVSRCVALLLVSGRSRKSSRSISNLTPSMAKFHNREPLPLMTTRTRMIGDRSESMNGSGDSTDDATVLIWISDVDSGVKYTLEVYSGQNPERSISSTCPVVSLREPQTPRSVYRRGDAVILHPAFTSAISERNGGFDISILIH